MNGNDSTKNSGIDSPDETNYHSNDKIGLEGVSSADLDRQTADSSGNMRTPQSEEDLCLLADASEENRVMAC